MTAAMRIGIDFDNTIITYDDVFLARARELGLVGVDFSGGKQAVRDSIRLLPEGETAWMRLQGQVYGKGTARAKLFDGVASFLRRCKAEQVPVVIVSHKTEYGHFDPDRVNLRHAAVDWMTAQGFFLSDGIGLKRENVHFEATRDDKIARIAALGCTHFIDDLSEVLTDPGFPSGVRRILFANEASEADGAYIVCPTWRQIEQEVFRERA